MWSAVNIQKSGPSNQEVRRPRVQPLFSLLVRTFCPTQNSGYGNDGMQVYLKSGLVRSNRVSSSHEDRASSHSRASL